MDAHLSRHDQEVPHAAFSADEEGLRLLPTGTVPLPLVGQFLGSPVGRWWVPALAGELKAPQRSTTLLKGPGVHQHRMDDEQADPLIVPSEWGVF
jgi:hypothetical protein